MECLARYPRADSRFSSLASLTRRFRKITNWSYQLYIERLSMQFAYTTILNAPRFGWQSPPSQADRLQLYGQVHSAGFDAIEWSPRWLDYHRLSSAEIVSMRRELKSCGLTVSGINLNRFILSRCPEAEQHHQRLLRSFEVAEILGAGAVIISLSMSLPPTAERPRLIGQTVPEAEFRETADLLRQAARHSAHSSVQLVLELHDDGLLDSPELCLKMLELIDEPNVFFNPDLGNVVRNGSQNGQWRQALEQLAPRAGYWHVKNYCNGQPVPIWEGDIDYSEAWSIMKQNGYAGWVSIESYFGDNVMDLQQQSLNWLRNLNGGTAQ